MKKIIFSLALLGGILTVSANRLEAGDKNICYCHAADSNPHTICTSDSAQQKAHEAHHDEPFGCECGNGVCEAGLGEDCGTCAVDCGACNSCGDGVVGDGEECGEEGISCLEGEECAGCRCLSLCGNRVVDFGEACDGGECCDDNCTTVDSCGGMPECQPIDEICDLLDNNCNGEVDEGDVCVAQGSPQSGFSTSAGGGLCSLNAGVSSANGTVSLVMFSFAALSLLLARRWKGTR